MLPASATSCVTSMGLLEHSEPYLTRMKSGDNYTMCIKGLTQRPKHTNPGKRLIHARISLPLPSPIKETLTQAWVILTSRQTGLTDHRLRNSMPKDTHKGDIFVSTLQIG